MKKLIILLVIALSYISYGSELKGSNYISTQPGTTYVYTRNTPDTDNESFIEITVNNYLKDKNLCKYTSKIKDYSKKVLIGSEYKYIYSIKNNGAVYTADPVKDGKEQLLFPADIQLNKIEKHSSANSYSKTTGYSMYTKYIANIGLNGKIYKNCIELKDNSTTTSIYQTITIESQQIYCKGIGLVKTKVKETHNSDEPLIYTDTLSSITKP